MSKTTEQPAIRRWYHRLVRLFSRKKATRLPTDLPCGFMVIDGRIVKITSEIIEDGFKNCKTLTTLESCSMPDSITSAAFDISSNTEPTRSRGSIDTNN